LEFGGRIVQGGALVWCGLHEAAAAGPEGNVSMDRKIVLDSEALLR